MNKLTFNTTKKIVTFVSEKDEYKYENIKTVKPQNGYYELMQEENEKTYPVLRVPINDTIMYLEHDK